MIVRGRYTFDKKRLRLSASGADPLSLGLLDDGAFLEQAEDEFDQFTGRLGLNFRATKTILSYFHFSQGYKAGGFDGNASSSLNFKEPFKAEKANTLEWGLKSEWFSNTLRSNIAVFYTDYEDLQVFLVKNNGTQFISNAASAKVRGAEMELAVNLSRKLGSELSCTYLDNEYESFISAVDDNADGLPDDLSGNRLTRSPEYACHIAISFQPIIASTQPLHVFLQYMWQDKMFITPQNRLLDTVDDYSLLNLNIRYIVSSNLSVSLYGKNLTNEEYKLHTFDVDPLVRNNIQSSVYANPFTWGISLRYDI